MSDSHEKSIELENGKAEKTAPDKKEGEEIPVVVDEQPGEPEEVGEVEADGEKAEGVEAEGEKAEGEETERDEDGEIPVVVNEECGQEPTAEESEPAESAEADKAEEGEAVEEEVGGEGEGEKEGDDELEAVRAELAETQDELKKARDRMLRIAADFENFKKRARRDSRDADANAKNAVIREMLPVVDNLERAIDHATGQGTLESMVEGVRIVLRQFATALTKFEVESFESLGKPFDPALHEAVNQAESDEHPAGTVMEEWQKGYTLAGRLIRPAMVVVSTGPAGGKAAPEQELEERSEPEPETETGADSGKDTVEEPEKEPDSKEEGAKAEEAEEEKEERAEGEPTSEDSSAPDRAEA